MSGREKKPSKNPVCFYPTNLPQNSVPGASVGVDAEETDVLPPSDHCSYYGGGEQRFRDIVGAFSSAICLETDSAGPKGAH